MIALFVLLSLIPERSFTAETAAQAVAGGSQEFLTPKEASRLRWIGGVMLAGGIVLCIAGLVARRRLADRLTLVAVVAWILAVVSSIA